jgi:outer membrane protein assembly factor BamB
MNGRVYVFANVESGVNEQERVVCLDADTGKILWEHRFGIFLTTIVSNRLGWSSPVGDPETGNVYVHGTAGLLICLDASGKVVWQRSLTEEFGRVSGYGGRLHTPVVDGDLLILSFLNSSWGAHGKGAHRYVAFDKRDGKVIWWSDPGGQPLDMTYACPVVAVINGRRLLIAPAADGAVHALQVQTGEKVWTFRLSERGLNTSPVVWGNRVYASHSEENLDSTVMGRVVCIDATGTGDVTDSHELWRLEGLTAGYVSPTIHDGRLYVVDNAANLSAINAETGKPIWSHKIGTVGKGSPVWADGKIYVGEVNGEFHIIEAGADAAKSLDVEAFSNPDGTVVEVYGSPAIANGRVYFLTRNSLYCIGSKSGGSSFTTTHGTQPVGLAPADAKVAKLLVVPGDVEIKPGEKIAFTVRGYDDKGRYLRDVEANWMLPTPPPPPKVGPMAGTPQMGPLVGTLGSGEASFTADAGIPFQAGVVLAKTGDLNATVRVRVAPDIPFREDFEGVAVNGVPGGWIGVQGKCRVVEQDGGKVLKKLANSQSPPFARIFGNIAPVSPAGYTVEADIKGINKGRRFYPDMGLLNCRYQLILVGTTAKPKLRIVGWSPMPRLQKEIDFNWKPKVWYRVKFSVDVSNDQGLLRGKVWPRDEAEPAAWTIEVTDPMPYVAGSPGIYAYSTGVTQDSPGTEVFFDNVKVTRNQ